MKYADPDKSSDMLLASEAAPAQTFHPDPCAASAELGCVSGACCRMAKSQRLGAELLSLGDSTIHTGPSQAGTTVPLKSRGGSRLQSALPFRFTL